MKQRNSQITDPAPIGTRQWSTMLTRRAETVMVGGDQTENHAPSTRNNNKINLFFVRSFNKKVIKVTTNHSQKGGHVEHFAFKSLRSPYKFYKSF